jgi:hypothetical protein
MRSLKLLESSRGGRRPPKTTSDSVSLYGSKSSNRAIHLILAMVTTLVLAGTAEVTSLYVALLIVFCCGVLVASVQRLRSEQPTLGLLHPAVLIFVFLGITYVARPIYVLRSGEFGTHQIGGASAAAALPYMERSLTIVAGALLTFSICFFLSSAQARSKPLATSRSGPGDSKSVRDA